MILYRVTKLTRTPHSSIFQVHAVLDSTQALSHVGLCTKAVDIVQPDGLIGATSSKVGIGKGNRGPREVQLTAYHLGILYSPEVITHRPPGVVVVHLHPPLQRGGASHQPDLHIDHWSGCVWKKKIGQGEVECSRKKEKVKGEVHV